MNGYPKAEQERRWREFLEKNPPTPKDEQENRWAQIAARRREDEKPVVEALDAAGWPSNVRQCGDARSVWDLVNTTESYPHLIDTLADHLVRPYDKYTRESIARALAVKDARGSHVQRVLMEELKKETDPNEGPNSYRWVLINTLVFIGDTSLAEDVQQLLRDPRYATVHRDLQRLAKSLYRAGRSASPRRR